MQQDITNIEKYTQNVETYCPSNLRLWLLNENKWFIIGAR